MTNKFCADFVILVALATVLPPAAQAVDSIADRSALTDLYRAMGGAQWKNRTNWLAPNVSMCSWYGVVCAPPGACPATGGTSVECRVAQLNLGANRLKGPIAPAVQQLANLTKLVLGRNALGGTIPSFVALASLEWLDLSAAQLGGSIPEFESLVNLRALRLRENSLKGTLPTFFHSIRLEHLDLSACFGLTGTIPSFSNLTQMRIMSLELNQFEGSIPNFEALAQLQQLFLNDNLLSGTVPAFASLTRLQYLYLYKNRLEGTIPSFDTLSQLLELSLNDNRLAGTIPLFNALTQLRKLYLYNNSLAGTVPSFDALTQLRELYLKDNGLSGQLPTFASLTRLQKLSLYNNRLSGQLPTFAALLQLQYLYLYNNSLEGTIPSFDTLTQLRYLYLSNNRLEGTVPSFDTLTQLQTLSLNNNRLSGQLPTFAALSQLQEFGISNNRLEGTVPSFDTLTQLWRLSLYNNRLEGTVPSFHALTQLLRLSLHSNLLQGTVPSFDTLTQLQTLYLNNNQLSGQLPTFAALSELSVLVLHNNLLSGTVPAFAALQLWRLNLHSNLLEGTVPSFDALMQLNSLDLHMNSLSGTVPNFENTTMLHQLDLSANLLSGTLPPLSSLSRLTVLRVARNRLTGSLPTSWRALRNLDLVDVADNMLDGQIPFFRHDPLPPLSAAFVNLSFNQFGRSFGEPPPPALTSIDIRSNQLLCPYPEFQLSLRVLRSDCKHDWVELGTYAGVAVGVAAVGIALFLGIKRHVSEHRVRISLFSLSWFVSASSVLSDAYSYAAIVQFLQTQSSNCVSMNEERVFYPLMNTDGRLPWFLLLDRNHRGSSLFSEWLNPLDWRLLPADSFDIDLHRQLSEMFASACRQSPECEYAAALAKCYEAYPDLSTNGGGAHQAFLNAVFTFIAIRVAYELFCLVVIVISCARASLVLSCRVWIKGSAFLPLLLLRPSTRTELLDKVVLADVAPSEYIWELLTSGVFVTGLKLFAQTFYLLRVAQTGLAFSNWLSLVLGLVTAVRLLGQAAWSRRKMHQNALLEKHYAERAASGADFELNDLAGGGSVGMNDYVRM